MVDPKLWVALDQAHMNVEGNHMSTSRNARTSWGVGAAVAAAVVTTMISGSMSPATARPPVKPGSVTGLALSATLDNATYTVRATWNPANHATSYLAKLTTTSGTVLDQERVTTTAFDGATVLPAASTVVVNVTPYNQNRRGRSTKKSMVLPDLTAPTGSYVVSPQMSATGVFTIQQTQLADDVSTAAAIRQTIDWGDGTTSGPFDATVTSFDHSYGSTQAVYHPTVTVTDAAANTRTYQLTAVVDDTDAPTGSFSVAPSSAWAGWTRVTLNQEALSDNLSSPADITRTVDWGDGTSQPWTSGTTLAHRYETAGVYTPSVTVTDEAGNAASLASTAVTVTADTAAPGVRFTLPRFNKPSVARWTTLRGKATDAGTGVRVVQVKAIERRHGVWYAYRPGVKRWVVAATKSAAWTKAASAKVTTTDTNRWSSQLRRLKVGRLVYKVSAKDNVGNVSAWKFHQQLLTRP